MAILTHVGIPLSAYTSFFLLNPLTEWSIAHASEHPGQWRCLLRKRACPSFIIDIIIYVVWQNIPIVDNLVLWLGLHKTRTKILVVPSLALLVVR